MSQNQIENRLLRRYKRQVYKKGYMFSSYGHILQKPDIPFYGWDEKGNYRDKKGRFAECPHPIPYCVKANGQKRIVNARKLTFASSELTYPVMRPCCDRMSKVLVHQHLNVDDKGNWETPSFIIRQKERVCPPCAYSWRVTIDEENTDYKIFGIYRKRFAEFPLFVPNFKVQGTPHWTNRKSPEDMVLTSTKKRRNLTQCMTK